MTRTTDNSILKITPFEGGYMLTMTKASFERNKEIVKTVLGALVKAGWSKPYKNQLDGITMLKDIDLEARK